MRTLGLVALAVMAIGVGAVQATAAEPKGRLGTTEYRINLTVEQKLKRFDIRKSTWRARLLAACVAFRAPGSRLLDSEHEDCLALRDFLAQYRGFTGNGRACSRRPDPYACLAGLLQKLAATATAEATAASATNNVLRERGITGACRRAIGSSQRRIDAMRGLAADATRAADAATAVDAKTMGRYADAVDRKVSAALGAGENTHVSDCRRSS